VPAPPAVRAAPDPPAPATKRQFSKAKLEVLFEEYSAMEFSLTVGPVISSMLLIIVVVATSFAVAGVIERLNRDRFVPTVQSGRSRPPSIQMPSWNVGASS
jgi:hypothetical protein